MTTTKIIKPSGSYLIGLPDNICDRDDGSVSSFWWPGNSLLLQLSSYVRSEGIQVGARDRLEQRIAKHPGNWRAREGKVHPENSVDQAAAEFLDENGVLWIHAYLVWPHLTVYATLSGPEGEVRKPDSWAMDALKSIKLVVQ